MLAAPNLYERFLSLFSKPAALSRYKARLAFDDSVHALQGAVKAYEAVEKTRLRKRKIDQRSPNQINQVSGELLRFQGRNLEENHDLAEGVLKTLVTFVIGRGIRTIPMVKDMQGELLEPVNQQLQQLWLHWTRRAEVTRLLSWNEVQRLMVRSWLRDGEVFARSLMGKVPDLEHVGELMYSLQLLEADFCPMGLTKQRMSIRQGISTNVWGQPQEYLFHKEYPTERHSDYGFGFGLSTSPLGSIYFVDETELLHVPANRVDHLRLVKRLGSLRGNSIFAAVLSRLGDLKDYEESERVAARIAAAFALVMTRAVDSQDPNQKSSNPDWTEMDIVPGMIAHDLLPGEKLEVLKNERPSNRLLDFRKANLQAVASGTGAGYSSTSKDYGGNYSSQRQELQEQNAVYLGMRDEFVNNFVEPVYRKFIMLVRLQGLVPGLGSMSLDELAAAKHVGTGVPYIDPKKEMEADAIAIKNRIKSRSGVIWERFGLNPKDVAMEIAREQEFDADLGLPPVGAEAEPDMPDAPEPPEGD